MSLSFLSTKVFADSHFLVSVVNFNTEAAISWRAALLKAIGLVVMTDNTADEADATKVGTLSHYLQAKAKFGHKEILFWQMLMLCCPTHTLPRKALLGKDRRHWENKCPNRELIQSWRWHWVLLLPWQPTHARFEELGGAAEKAIPRKISAH